MVCEYSGGSGHTLPALVVQQFSLGKSFSLIAFKRKVLFRGRNISEEPCPAKVDTHRCHVLDTIVDLYLAPCQCAYCFGRVALNYGQYQGKRVLSC